MAATSPRGSAPAGAGASAQHILTVSCPDTIGIVAAVSGFLAEHGCFINESSHFSESTTGRFYMRTVFESADTGWEVLAPKFAPLAERFDMDW